MNPKSKERLVGSLVLICLAIIFIPPFYDGRNPFDLEEEKVRVNYSNPPKFADDQKTAESLADLGKGRLDKIEAKVKASQPESSRSDLSSESLEDNKTVLSDFSEDARELTSQLLSDIAESSEIASRFTDKKTVKQAWAVQVGSFKEVARAQQLRDQLVAKSYQSYIKTLVKDGQQISRVFAGVSLDKSVADDIQKSLKNDFDGLSSIVVPYQP